MRRILVALLSLLAVNAQADQTTAFAKLRAATTHIDIGTGFLVKGKSGRIFMVTNFHVCTNERGMQPYVHGSTQEGHSFVGRIAFLSPDTDLCAISVNQEDAKGQALEIGAHFPYDGIMYTRGYPHGVVGEFKGIYAGQFEWYITFAIDEVGVCPKNFTKIFDTYGKLIGCTKQFTSLRTTHFSLPGSSGSPVVNEQGQLIAVLHAGGPDGAGLIPLESVKLFLDSL